MNIVQEIASRKRAEENSFFYIQKGLSDFLLCLLEQLEGRLTSVTTENTKKPSNSGGFFLVLLEVEVFILL